MININDVDIKNMDNDSLLNMLDKLGLVYANVIVEATQRANDIKFTDEQVKLMIKSMLNRTCLVYDTLGINEDEMVKGSKMLKNALFDVNR